MQNNRSSLYGGAIFRVSNNCAGTNNIINVKQSLIDSNFGRNGGGIYINGNSNSGNDHLIEVNIENSTISNNNAISLSSGNGDGAIFYISGPWTANTVIENITLGLIHATIYNNIHDALTKSRIKFGSPKVTNFSVYNSLIVSFGYDVATKCINFANFNLTDMKNCILGALQNDASALTIIL